LLDLLLQRLTLGLSVFGFNGTFWSARALTFAGPICPSPWPATCS
jgi:hypothetical protein